MIEDNYTAFIYQYRDAGNYKAPGLLLLLGKYDPAAEQLIRSACDSWDHFVAEQIKIPTLYAELYLFSGGPNIDDIAFHEFHSLRPATVEQAESLSLWGSLEDLVSRFQSIKLWDCRLSPHCF